MVQYLMVTLRHLFNAHKIKINKRFSHVESVLKKLLQLYKYRSNETYEYNCKCIKKSIE